MGCALGRALDPSAPDPAVRHLWHIRGILLDGSKGDERVQRRRAGVLFVYNGQLCYRARYCSACVVGTAEPLQMDLADISHTTPAKQFYSKTEPEKRFKCNVADLTHTHGGTSQHIGIVADDAETLSKELNEIIQKHRQKPRIFQFNSIDIEGVEVDVP